MSQRKRSRRKRSPSRPTASRSPPGKTPASERTAGWLPIILLVIVTFAAYANAWPNSLSFDDRVFVDDDRFAVIQPADFVRFFGEDLWAASGAESKLYRPLLLVSLALQAQVFGDWYAGYHLVNILLHILATILVFGLVRHLVSGNGSSLAAATYPAALAAMVFGVHPVHTEVVNSIFNGSEIMVCIGVAGGLWWFLRTQDDHPRKAWWGLALIYLGVLLCRESAAALPALAVVLLFLTRPGPWLPRLRQCLPVLWMLVPLCLYLALRGQVMSSAFAADATGEAGAAALEQARSLADLTSYGLTFGPERVLPAVSLWFESLKLLLWPYPLQLYYDTPRTSPWIAPAAQLALLVYAVVEYRRRRPGLLLGLAFFYLAILPSSRIIGEMYSAPLLSDRILYLPSVALSLVLGFALKGLISRFSLRSAALATLILLMALTPLTWARNELWGDDVLLFEADYNRLKNKGFILNTLLAAHVRTKNYPRAVELCDLHAGAVQGSAPAAMQCGTAYGKTGRFDSGEQAYLAAARHPNAAPFAHANVAVLYLHLGRRAEAEEQMNLAIEAGKKEFMKEYFRALALIHLHPNERSSLLEARSHLEQSLELQPQFSDAREELRLLDQRLNPPKR